MPKYLLNHYRHTYYLTPKEKEKILSDAYRRIKFAKILQDLPDDPFHLAFILLIAITIRLKLPNLSELIDNYLSYELFSTDENESDSYDFTTLLGDLPELIKKHGIEAIMETEQFAEKRETHVILALANNFNCMLYLMGILENVYFTLKIFEVNHQIDDELQKIFCDTYEELTEFFYTGNNIRQRLFRTYVPQTIINNNEIELLTIKATANEIGRIGTDNLAQILIGADRLLRGDDVLWINRHGLIVSGHKNTYYNEGGDPQKIITLAEARKLLVKKAAVKGWTTKTKIEFTADRKLMDYLFLREINWLPD
jgi:hypothetical protein